MMDESFDSVVLSPTRLLARLQELRSLQEAARDKLQHQRRLCGSSSTETSDSIQELLTHLSKDSTSYRTFQNLLQGSHDDTPDSRSSQRSADVSRRSSQKIRSDDLIDGVSLLNLSQESEPVLGSPSSGRSKMSNKSDGTSKTVENAHLKINKPTNSTVKKHIELEEIPILSPRRDFETLLLEKIEMEKVHEEKSSKPVPARLVKKPFLRRGDGLSRFGVKRDDLVIQNTKSLPWKRRSMNNSQRANSTRSDPCGSTPASQSSLKCKDTISESVKEEKSNSNKQPSHHKVVFSVPAKNAPLPTSETNKKVEKPMDMNERPQKITLAPKPTKTWAAVLTQEQDTFLRQLKQSSYYKNFESPAKSVASEDASCDESLHRLRHEREAAEQNLFELLENKVSNASFCSESSFFHKFFKSKPDCSGDNTPLMLQRCLTTNPQLLQLFPQPEPPKGHADCSGCVEEKSAEHTYESEYEDCDHETCSSTSSCCTCRTVEETSTSVLTSTPHVEGDGKQGNNTPDKFKNKHEKENTTLDQTVTTTDEVKANMVEMNAKLTATSELLKERLHELEDEIEMFRQENAALAKTREEIDAEKQRFYDEKSAYEQKFNEDKVLSEYYLAEEKEKLAKQKQVYDRYVREMRGRLNRKEKDEVAKLKKDMEGLKEEFRNKDAKLTSCIARLRNQLKIVEKEKKDLQEECEKLKKENRRIQQINTTTRRLSNIKYLAEINKKLALIGNNDKMPKVVADDDVKYKMSEMETRGRAKKLLPTVNRQLRVRAKSVPNLTVTSRYAKYFSQRDAISQMERERALGEDFEDGGSVHSDYSSDIDYNTLRNYEQNLSNASKNMDSDLKNAEMNCSDEDNLERIYSQTFKNTSVVAGREAGGISARSNKSLGSHSGRQLPTSRTKSPISGYNLCTSESNYSHTSKSPIPPLNLSRSGSSNTLSRSKSPISILSNRSSMGSRKSFVEHSPSHEETPTDSLHRQLNEDNNSRTSLTRTNLSPTEIKKPDGARELRFPNGNVKVISADGKTSKFMYYNGDIKETFHNEGKIKYYYAETKTYHTTHVDGLEVLQFPDGQVEKRYGDGSVEIRLANGSVRYTDPRSEHVSEEWRFPDGAVLTVSRDGEQVVRFPNGQVEVHATDHKRREFPDGTVKLVYSDGTSETRYASGRVRIKDRQGALIMDSAPSR